MGVRKAIWSVGTAGVLVAMCPSGAAAQSGERCAAERGLYAERGMPRARIVIANQANYPVRVFWIDEGGRRVPYANLAPGRTFRSLSFVSHPWVVTDVAGNCRQVFFTEQEDRTFVFNAPDRRRRYEPEPVEGPDTVEPLTEADAGQVTDIPLAQETTIALRSNPTAGYHWEVRSTINVRIIGDVSEERAPGGGGTSLVSFRVIGRGRAGITLVYVAEDDDRPRRTLVYRFNGI